MLTVRVLWACHAFNATPEEAAQQVAADLFDLLARGGSVLPWGLPPNKE
jgi:hypothetical protein